MSAAGITTASPARSGRKLYFFLSYAHPAPTAHEVGLDTGASADPWVARLFRDLTEAVAHRASAPGPRPGFFDQEVPPGSDWNAALAEALGAAEVFVPLYSPSYLNNSWPERERKAFDERLASTSAGTGLSRVLPVLWTPFPPWEDRAEIGHALALADDIPEYAENGLRAMCMVSYYRAQYLAIVERLARRIVDLAENSPVNPSPAPAPEDVSRPSEAPAFLAAVLAPDRSTAPLDRAGAAVYGETGAQWRPFARQQALPAAAYVAITAERLGLLPASIVNFADSTDLLNKHPAVLLIDPWVLRSNGGERILLEAAKSLPRWVIPVVVVDNYAATSGQSAQLAEDALAMLSRAGVPRRERVGAMQEFVEIMPALVTDARRQYLRHGPISRPTGDKAPRYRLGDPDGAPTDTGTG